jgi:cysteinyl-tRNA synthetase
MSKSLGNFEPLSSLLDRHDPQAIRMLFLQTGYRKPMNFTESSISGAETGLRRLYDAYDLLRGATTRVGDEAAAAAPGLAEIRRRLYAALDDDMNTAGALAELFATAANAADFASAGAGPAAAGFMHEAMGVLGISPNERTLASPPPPAELGETVAAYLQERFPDVVPAGATPAASVQAVVDARNAARRARDFKRADDARGALSEIGVTLTDTKDGTTWSVAG